MHSSRMRTVRLLPVSSSMHGRGMSAQGVPALGVVCPGGVCPGGLSAQGVSARVCVSQHAMGQTPPVGTQTPVKT